MPINYSKFDNIVDSDEEETALYGGGGLGGGGGGGDDDLARLMDMLAAAGDGAAPPCPPAPGERDPFWDSHAAALDALSLGRQAPPAREEPYDLGLGGLGYGAGFGDFGDPLQGYGAGFGDFGDPYGDDFGDPLQDADYESSSLDMEALRKQAWHLLLGRLVSRPNAAGAARALLLEAELLLMAYRYEEALVASLAIQIARAPAPCTAADAGALAWRTGGRWSAEDVVGHSETTDEWTAPALAIQMVSCYQLGDRGRAAELRDQLQLLDRGSLSEHLEKRFTGTSEVLDLVPQFMNLLKAAEEERRGQEPP